MPAFQMFMHDGRASMQNMVQISQVVCLFAVLTFKSATVLHQPLPLCHVLFICTFHILMQMSQTENKTGASLQMFLCVSLSSKVGNDPPDV